MGKFNPCYKSVVLRINEVRDFGEAGQINRYNFYDHMKWVLATPPETLKINEKYTNEYRIWNCVGVIYTTNYKVNGIYLPPEDRRHYVAWSDRKRTDFPTGYWDTLFDWYPAGGCEHVAAYLSQIDLTKWDAKAAPPRTEAFWEIVESNKAPENAEFGEALEELGNPKAVTLRHIHNVAFRAFKDWLDDRKNRGKIPRRMKDCGYVPLRNPDVARDGTWVVSGKKCAVYVREELSVKEQFQAVNDLIHKERPAGHFGAGV
jgi:hypothetical protein